MDTSNNFRCPVTGKEFMIAHYWYTYKSDGTMVYMDAKGARLVNPENGEPLQFIEKPITGFPTAIDRTRGMSHEGRSEVIKKRSKAHNKKQKERWHSMNMGRGG